jgi:hypothetical protein
MNKALSRLKPGAPKVLLIFLGAALWCFAAYRILRIGIGMIERHALFYWLNYLIGLAGFIPFFLLVFRKVSRRTIDRIKSHPSERPCVFGFFDLKGYLLMSLMIGFGILFSRWQLIPELYKGTFFISLGLSLLASAIFYIFEGVKFVREKERRRKKRQMI